MTAINKLKINMEGSNELNMEDTELYFQCGLMIKMLKNKKFKKTTPNNIKRKLEWTEAAIW